MIIECALVDVDPDRAEDFEAVLGKARELVAGSSGCRSVTFGRCVERPGGYAVMVEWDTIEDHTERFVGSDRATQMSALVGPFVTGTPTVEHYEVIG